MWKYTEGTPWLAKYIKGLGQTIAQYDSGIKVANAVADGIIEKVSELHETDTGVYWPTEELNLNDSIHHDFVRHCLKDRGMEFIEGGTLYRI
jgi:gamma-glutamyl-gamma-aminobutyrate hydrolase PuuD